MRKLTNKVGTWVTGEDFWGRENEVKRLTELFDEGENIFMIAPRRVGKTSLLRETLGRLEEKYYSLFVDIQDCTMPEEVIVSISLATKKYDKPWKKTVGVFKDFLGDAVQKIESVGNDYLSIKLREGVMGDWKAKGDRIFQELCDMDRPVIIALDELPVMITRLLLSKGDPATQECIKQADVFLSWLRRCADTYKNIRFVICGSIGLEPVVHRYRMSSTIAHLHPFHLEQWDKQTADGCLSALAAKYEIELGDDERAAMLDLLGCCIPHHVQMFFGYVRDYSRSQRTGKPCMEDIDRIYNQYMLGTRGHAELATYEERLLRVLGQEMKTLALDLLTETAVTGQLTAQAAEIIANDNMLKGAAAKEALRDVLEVLLHDGYLIRLEDGNGGHVFNSKLLRDWWKRRFGDGFVPANQREA